MNLVSKKDKSKVVKQKKFKRRRDVFGKRLFRIWLVALIAVEALAITFVSLRLKSNQKEQKTKIENEISTIQSRIEYLLRLSNKKQTTYEDIGTLVATLPSSFDKQTCNIDIDRLLSISGLVESKNTVRIFSDNAAIPFTTSVKTLKAVQINLTVQSEDISYVLAFIDNVTNYEQENFFYIDSIVYSNDDRGTCVFVLYTFYNDVAV